MLLAECGAVNLEQRRAATSVRRRGCRVLLAWLPALGVLPGLGLEGSGAW